tara:strand:+ start:40 stop:180 length:141 start_codon:yes stop_codon:yes gene_type:complete
MFQIGLLIVLGVSMVVLTYMLGYLNGQRAILEAVDQGMKDAVKEIS